MTVSRKVSDPTFRNPQLPLEERVSSLLSELTREEKLSLCAGRNFWETKAVPRLELRPFRMSDGPRGVAFHSARRRGTSFPSGIALGASWDPGLAERVGQALGAETRAAGCQMILGPAVNICRTPLGGRTFEYFTEDPHLNRCLTVPYIRGVQSEGVAACIKHYAANNQETHRMRNSSRVSERALREIYLPAFEAAVREGDVWSVMAAYNAVNGVAACENRELLWDRLREEWGFRGFVVSDWFAVRRTRSAEACLEAGLSLEMPGRGSRMREGALRRADAAGRIDEKLLDRGLRGLLRVMFLTGHIDARTPERRRRISTPAHRELAREAAEAGLTLLKNEDALLPLDPSKPLKLAVLGPKARARNCLPLWGGSSGVWPPEEVTPLRGLREALGSWGSLVASPAEADVAILFLGQSHRPGMDSEMRDRSRLELPAKQVRLIRETVRANPRTIVVLIAGSPIAMEWAHSVPAILMAWYPGMEGGRAIANALLGKVNPSGKLPVTFPRKLDDSPAHRNHETFPGNKHEVRYDEDIFVGYRHFDRAEIEPLYAFGHGLSYTRFDYDELTLSAASWEGEGSLDVSFTLTNRGPRAGAEVIQLYVGNREGRTPRPLRELKAFRKILLEAGQCQRVEIELTTRDFAVYSEPAGSWLAEAGEFSVAVGSSSRDIRLEAPVALLKDQLLSR